MLFKIEAAVRAGFAMSVCTDEACQWNIVFVKNIKGVPLSDIALYDEERIRKFREKREAGTQSENKRNTLKEEKQKEGLEKISKLEKKPIVLHCFSGYF